MPRLIPTPYPLRAIDGVLIRRQQLEQSNRANNLMQQARLHAQRCLRDARKQTKEIQQHAWQEGYLNGMQAAFQQIVTYLTDSHNHARTWEAQLDQQVKTALTGAVTRPEIILQVLDEWLQTQKETSISANLHLCLPSAMRSQHKPLMAVLNERWQGNIHIDYHAETRLLLRCADQVAEFAPEYYVETTVRQLQQQWAFLATDCAQLSQIALQQWHQQLSQYLTQETESILSVENVPFSSGNTL
jgi:hypothetical protein